MNHDTEQALVFFNAELWIAETLYSEIKDFSPKTRKSRDAAIDVLYWWFTSSDAYHKHYYHIPEMCAMVNEVNPDNVDWDVLLDWLHTYGSYIDSDNVTNRDKFFEESMLEGLSSYDYT